MAVQLVSRAPRSRPSRPDAGFSLIEALIAAVILLIIALGLIPLFARSIRDNAVGADATQATNHGKAELEECLQLPFNNQKLAIPGAATVAAAVESWALGDPAQLGDANEGWVTGAPTNKGVLVWTRTTSVRQYNISDLEDNGALTTPLPGNAQPIFVHLKEVEVEMDGDRGPVLGGGRHAVYRVLKPF
jgi:Tfp pilus assembly protein PilV